MLGVPDYDKVSKLLHGQAVLTQVKANSGKFRELLHILGEEPALETSVNVLTKALEGIHVGACMEEGICVIMQAVCDHKYNTKAMNDTLVTIYLYVLLYNRQVRVVH